MCVLTPPSQMSEYGSDDQSDVDEQKFYNPFCLPEVELSLGCPAAFADGSLKWTKACAVGRSSDASVLAKAQELFKAHADGATLSARQGILGELFNMQYNAPAIIFYAKFFCTSANTTALSTKAAATTLLVEENAPFIPWNAFHSFLVEKLEECKSSVTVDVAPVDWLPAYLSFMRENPFGINSRPAQRNGGSSVTSTLAAKRASLADWKLAMESAKVKGLTDDERTRLSGEDTPASPREAEARRKALEAKHEADALKAAADERAVREKRRREDEDEDRPLSGLLALEKFMRATRLTIENSRYIDFASMSKDRLDQLQVLGVGSASSKRLSSSTVLVTSASEADIKILTFDYEAIASGFLFTYINLLSEASFPDAMARVKDRLAWWQWLTGFFGSNKPAAVKFIHSFMLKHHMAPFWVPVTEERCSMLAIQARDTCPLPERGGANGASQQHQNNGNKSAPRSAKNSPAKVFPGPGTLTIHGGVTFTASQTAKLVQWRSRFPGYCQSRMTKEYTCSREKRGMSCKYKHECAWCHSPSCKAACAQAEKL